MKVFDEDTAKQKIAVAGVSFSVAKGEIFGLLGPNGAGKTTTLSILTGEQKATSGSTCIDSVALTDDNTLEIFQKLGFCPQFSALWPTIKVEEHLRLFAGLRGYSDRVVSQKVRSFMNMMRIAEYAEFFASDISGGTQRKLSVGIALVNAPKIFLLDEPSTGLDPGARHFLWDVIKSSSESRATILTTHSMEEAESLSTTISIMTNGKLQCIGSPQHLKTKYGYGYTLEIKAPTDRVSEVQAYIHSSFSEASLLEVYDGHLKFRVNGQIRLAQVFRALEQAMTKYGVTDYSFSQPSLEQVFLFFAKQQETSSDS